MNYTLTDEELVRQYLSDRTPHHLATLYNRHADRVYQQCLAITKDKQNAQDYTHDIFLKIFKRLRSFQQRAHFTTWIYSVTRNYCIDQIRLVSRFPTSAISTELLETVGETLDGPEKIVRLTEQALESLTSIDQILLRLKYEEGMRIDQIAYQCGLSPSAVKMRLYRSRNRVKLIYSQQKYN